MKHETKSFRTIVPSSVKRVSPKLKGSVSQFQLSDHQIRELALSAARMLRERTFPACITYPPAYL